MPVKDKTEDVEMTEQKDSKAVTAKKDEEIVEEPKDKFFGKWFLVFYF